MRTSRPSLRTFSVRPVLSAPVAVSRPSRVRSGDVLAKYAPKWSPQLFPCVSRIDRVRWVKSGLASILRLLTAVYEYAALFGRKTPVTWPSVRSRRTLVREHLIASQLHIRSRVTFPYARMFESAAALRSCCTYVRSYCRRFCWGIHLRRERAKALYIPITSASREPFLCWDANVCLGV